VVKDSVDGSMRVDINGALPAFVWVGHPDSAGKRPGIAARLTWCRDGLRWMAGARRAAPQAAES
jgi:hypothetical protein